jgi:hypothetical protein
MSQENVEVLRRGYAAPDPLTTFAERIAPDVEFDFTAVYPDRPVFRGTDAVRRFLDEGPWAGTIHFEPERFFDIDDERVLVFVRVTAIGQESVLCAVHLGATARCRPHGRALRAAT